MSDWFTADTHFGHTNVIAYCERPFASVEDMDSELIRRWNERVSDTDRIYHLGDFACGPKTEAIAALLARLNGYKILVMGNHDRGFSATKWKRLGFAEVFNQHGSSYGDFELSHFPYLKQETDARDFSHYQKTDGGKFLLHGHVHRAWKVKDWMINVGVDVWDYAPVPGSEIFKIALLSPMKINPK